MEVPHLQAYRRLYKHTRTHVHMHIEYVNVHVLSPFQRFTPPKDPSCMVYVEACHLPHYGKGSSHSWVAAAKAAVMFAHATQYDNLRFDARVFLAHKECRSTSDLALQQPNAKLSLTTHHPDAITISKQLTTKTHEQLIRMSKHHEVVQAPTARLPRASYSLADNIPRTPLPQLKNGVAHSLV